MSLTISPVVVTTGLSFNSASLDELAQEIERTGEVAEARWELDYQWNQVGEEFGVDATVGLSISMPIWTQVATRPHLEQLEWTRFLLALREHEDGHIAIYERMATAVWHALLRSSPVTIDAVAKRERARVDRLQAAYEARTEHGKRQNGRHGNTVISTASRVNTQSSTRT